MEKKYHIQGGLKIHFKLAIAVVDHSKIIVNSSKTFFLRVYIPLGEMLMHMFSCFY